MTKPTGFILYEGPSRIDGEPIVAIATGYGRKSQNTKTGHMIQVYILRQDIAPHEAVKAGQDKSVCGGCPNRGTDGLGRSCYVRVEQAPLSVWKAYKRQRYPHADSPYDLVAAGRGRMVRLGAYGDPAAVPLPVWGNFLTEAESWTGYTHQWRAEGNNHYRSILMASCDNLRDRVRAQLDGWRTFTVLTPGQAVPGQDALCPATMVAGTFCRDCGLCNGSSGKGFPSVATHVHGAANKVRAFCARLK